jgi:peptidyl-prolyl cis-trans isomerase SurA
VAGAALALGASGCDAEQLGAAAVVGGERITVDALQQSVLDFHDFLPDGTPPPADDATIQRTFLNRQILHRLYQDVAEQNDVVVTEAQIDAFLTQFETAQAENMPVFLAERGLTEQTARDSVYDALVSDALTAKLGSEQAVADALAEAAAAAGVWVNPRYGVWQDSGIEAVSGSISSPFEG